MNSRGMNCGAAAGYEAAQEVIKELKRRNNSEKYYDIVNDECIDLTNNLNYNTPKNQKIKSCILDWLKGFMITLFALAIVLGGYWLLFRIIS